LALVGDTSDNVPGVKGIGEKGAVQLLTEYGDLETMIARAGEIKQKRPREALQEHAELARLSKRLVTIQTDVPVELDLEALEAHNPDIMALAQVFQELEFGSLNARLDKLAAASGEKTASGGQRTASGEDTEASLPATSTEPALDVTILDDPARLPALVEKLRAAPLVAYDTETSSLEPHDAELIGLSVSISPTEVWYLPFGHRAPA